jgi:hypothetical protein
MLSGVATEGGFTAPFVFIEASSRDARFDGEALIQPDVC